MKLYTKPKFILPLDMLILPKLRIFWCFALDYYIIYLPKFDVLNHCCFMPRSILLNTKTRLLKSDFVAYKCFDTQAC